MAMPRKPPPSCRLCPGVHVIHGLQSPYWATPATMTPRSVFAPRMDVCETWSVLFRARHAFCPPLHLVRNSRDCFLSPRCEQQSPQGCVFASPQYPTTFPPPIKSLSMPHHVPPRTTRGSNVHVK